MTKTSTLTLELDDDLRDELMAEAEAVERPAAELVGDIVRDFFLRRKREEEEYRAFLQKKVDKARESIAAGRLIPNEEVEAMFAERRAELRRRMSVDDNWKFHGPPRRPKIAMIF